MKNLGKVAYLLIIIGALNWGLIGVANINLVAEIFGGGSMIAKIIYILVGVSAIYCLLKCNKGSCKK